MVSSFAAALVPVERDAREEASTAAEPATTAEIRPGEGRLVVRKLDATAEPQTVHIELGDQLRLSVAADRLDQVEIPALGEVEAVESSSPAEFDLYASEPGRFAIRLLDADRLVGEIEVAERAKGALSEPTGELSERG